MLIKIKKGRWLFPRLVVLVGKLGISHNSLILLPDVAVVWIVSEEPLAPLVVLLPVFVLGGGCRIILHLGWVILEAQVSQRAVVDLR